MSVAANDIILATFEGTCVGQRIMLTHTYRVASITAPPFDERTVCENIAERMSAGGANIIEGPLLNAMPSNYTLTGIHVQKIWPVRFRRFSLPLAAAGAIANAALSANVSTCLSMHSDEAGRSQVANKHVGPLATAVGWYTGGELTAGYKAVLDALGAALLSDITAAGWYNIVPTIFHRGDVVPKWNDIVGLVREDTVRVMRRRTVGLGI